MSAQTRPLGPQTSHSVSEALFGPSNSLLHFVSRSHQQHYRSRQSLSGRVSQPRPSNRRAVTAPVTVPAQRDIFVPIAHEASHKVSSPPSPTIACGFYRSSFTSQASLDRHMAQSHRYRCARGCAGRDFHPNRDLDRHYRTRASA